MSERNFFAELKRRNVYKVGVAYAVVGWLIAQVATQIFPFLEIPNWAIRLVIVLIVIGYRLGIRANAGRDQADRRRRSFRLSSATAQTYLDCCRDRWSCAFGRSVF